MDWSSIKRFCFTFAIQGGAWLEDSHGQRSWESVSTIDRRMGKGWFERQYQRHGIFTGCWIDVA